MNIYYDKYAIGRTYFRETNYINLVKTTKDRGKIVRENLEREKGESLKKQ